MHFKYLSYVCMPWYISDITVLHWYILDPTVLPCYISDAIFSWIHFRSFFIPGYILDSTFYLDKLIHSVSNINRKVDDGGGRWIIDQGSWLLVWFCCCPMSSMPKFWTWFLASQDSFFVSYILDSKPWIELENQFICVFWTLNLGSSWRHSLYMYFEL